jgi:glycosyltransferase A (GT-A) superfamily protein (DUF2064 family)
MTRSHERDTAVAIFASVSAEDNLKRASRIQLVEATCDMVADLPGVTNFLVGDESDRDPLSQVARSRDSCRSLIHGPSGPEGLRETVRKTARTLFERGYDRVLLMASDVPTLTREEIRSAIRQIDASDEAVVGPAPDGGFNYLGLGDWRGDVLENVPFFTDMTRARLLRRLRELNYQVSVHRFHRDIDQPHDWLSVAGDITHQGLLRLIDLIQSRLRHWSVITTSCSSNRAINYRALLTRAPPSFLL